MVPNFTFKKNAEMTLEIDAIILMILEREMHKLP
jgi:hypothetical protein